ncbi:MAG: hypothetical protein DRO98_05685 [Archaeoglobales archaeon]|nr:MAG: hypothetical protein DRO98_05685 [Archaeoglobales archaeon]
MRIRILNIVLAELAIFIAVGIAEASPLSMFIPARYLYFLAILPPVFLLLKRNPFDFPLFAILIVMASVKVLANSEMFYSILDTIYFFGFRGLAEHLNSIFSAYRSSPNISALSAIVILYVIAQISWAMEERLKKLGLGFGYPLVILGIVGFAIYLFYPLILSFHAYGVPLLFMGLIGVTSILIAIYLLAS